MQKAKTNTAKKGKSPYTRVPDEGEEPDAYVDPSGRSDAIKRYGGPVYQREGKRGRKEQLAPKVEKGKSDYRPRKESLKPGDFKVAYGSTDKATGRVKKFKIERIQ